MCYIHVYLIVTGFGIYLICFLCLSDSDLHMTALALELCCTLMTDKKSNQNVGQTVSSKVLPQALILIRSPLLQGQALQVGVQISGNVCIWNFPYAKVPLYSCAGFAEVLRCSGSFS